MTSIRSIEVPAGADGLRRLTKSATNAGDILDKVPTASPIGGGSYGCSFFITPQTQREFALAIIARRYGIISGMCVSAALTEAGAIGDQFNLAFDIMTRTVGGFVTSAILETVLSDDRYEEFAERTGINKVADSLLKEFGVRDVIVNDDEMNMRSMKIGSLNFIESADVTRTILAGMWNRAIPALVAISKLLRDDEDYRFLRATAHRVSEEIGEKIDEYGSFHNIDPFDQFMIVKRASDMALEDDSVVPVNIEMNGGMLDRMNAIFAEGDQDAIIMGAIDSAIETVLEDIYVVEEIANEIFDITRNHGRYERSIGDPEIDTDTDSLESYVANASRSYNSVVALETIMSSRDDDSIDLKYDPDVVTRLYESGLFNAHTDGLIIAIMAVAYIVAFCGEIPELSEGIIGSMSNGAETQSFDL